LNAAITAPTGLVIAKRRYRLNIAPMRSKQRLGYHTERSLTGTIDPFLLAFASRPG
jgi:hypothetical protein